jgi:hypothetical protein
MQLEQRKRGPPRRAIQAIQEPHGAHHIK